MSGLVIAGLAVLGGGGIALLAWALNGNPTTRAIKQVAKRRIADVAEGERARVVGTVELDTPITAPLSGRACAFWTVLIEEKGYSDLWHTVVAEHDGVDFYVRDESGRALVRLHAEHVEPSLTQDGRFSSNLFDDAGPRLQAFLTERGHTSKGWFVNKTMRYREGVVTSGERVAIVGQGRWEPDADQEPGAGGGYRDGARPLRLTLSCEGGKTPLLLSDEPSTTD